MASATKAVPAPSRPGDGGPASDPAMSFAQRAWDAMCLLGVLGDAAGGMSWAFVFQSVDDNSTRVITRVRAVDDNLGFGLFLRLILHPVDFAMQRRQLLNLSDSWRRRHDD